MWLLFIGIFFIFIFGVLVRTNENDLFEDIKKMDPEFLDTHIDKYSGMVKTKFFFIILRGKFFIIKNGSLVKRCQQLRILYVIEAILANIVIFGFLFYMAL